MYIHYLHRKMEKLGRELFSVMTYLRLISLSQFPLNYFAAGLIAILIFYVVSSMPVSHDFMAQQARHVSSANNQYFKRAVSVIICFSRIVSQLECQFLRWVSSNAKPVSCCFSYSVANCITITGFCQLLNVRAIVGW